MIELTAALADQIAKTAHEQLRTSRAYKAPRLREIRESEDLYLGIVPKTLRNPFNESFPFMPGFIDTIVSETDAPPNVKFTPTEEADLKASLKYTAAFENFAASSEPEAMLDLKDRWAKRLAAFSGRAIYKFYAESDPEYRSILEVKDHYEFHCEPNGGGILENHLWMGEDAIFKLAEDLKAGAESGFYDASQVATLLTRGNESEYKENEDAADERNQRHTALGMDVASNNFTGQAVYRFAEWYLTFKGERWYCLFDVHTGTWIRVKPLKEVFASNKWPYVSWATHEDKRVFWSKAPADDARPIARTINRFLNQELYNREKRNHGQKLYDPDMIIDLEALDNSRPDGLVPVKVGPGQNITQAISHIEYGEISGTIDLVSFLDSYAGQKTGVTPSSQGSAERDKKVGIFFGEMQQVKQRFSILNKSRREAWAQIGRLFVHGLHEHLNTEMAIKIMGGKGVEWTTISKHDLKTARPLDVKITGGQEEEQKSQLESQKKLEVLKSIQSANPRWKDEQLLRLGGFDDDDIKRAFDPTTSADRVLLSEAAQAEQDIVKGKKPKLNRGANAAYMQHILDFTADVADDISNETYDALIDFALAHAEIAAENEARSAAKMIAERTANQAPSAPVPPSEAISPTPQEASRPMIPTPPPSGGGMPMNF